ncbi:MAG: cyclase family protein [Tenericutes bacterium]|nr:cyclase family protein [Mycoplasmatota bacterium]
MEKWIDLTVLIDKNYLEYPGDIPFEQVIEKEFSKDYFNMRRITTNMHIGTHIDAPKHVLDIEEGIESIDINKVIGKAFVLQPRIIDGVIMTSDLIEQYNKDYKIVIIKTNHSKYLNTLKYYDYPVFTEDVIDFLVSNNIEVIALDMPSPKYKDEAFLNMHKDLLSRSILIVENLKNLDQLTKVVDFIALPLKIKGFDGSLIRCVAKNSKDN